MLFSFEDFSLDTDRRELKRAGNEVAVEPQVFDLLVHLVENRDRVVSRDDLISSVWGGRIVSESTLASRINAARQALGDSGDAQRLIKTIQRKGVRFIGDVQTSAAKGPDAAPVRINQDVTFCKAKDGVNLAVASSGDGMPVVKAANWLNHIEYDWQSPVWNPFLTLMSEQFRLVRYDGRGNGLSDWDAADVSFEALVRDLETVVDSLGLKRFALLGMSQGAAVSIAYATRHPERVSRLAICGGYAMGWRKRADAQDLEKRAALETLVRHGWGQDNPAFRQVFTSLFIPGGTHEQMQWWNDLQRVSTSPENAIRLGRAFGDIDVTELLPKIRTPTIVFHARNDARVPFDQGRELAQAIPGARFVGLESANHVILAHEPAWPRFTAELAAFFKEDAGAGR